MCVYVTAACDGLWDVMSSQEVVDFVAGFTEDSTVPGGDDVSEALVKKALEISATENNMTRETTLPFIFSLLS